MKKIIFAALLSGLLAGCAPEEPQQRWDYPNVEVAIAVKNAEGENMLSPRTSGNILDRGVKIVWDGQDYPLQGIPATRATEPDLPEFRGLVLSVRWDGSAGMAFGEFSIDTREYRNEKFVLSWEGASYEISFDLYATPGGKGQEPVITQATRIDGVPHSNSTLAVTITAE